MTYRKLWFSIFCFQTVFAIYSERLIFYFLFMVQAIWYCCHCYHMCPWHRQQSPTVVVDSGSKFTPLVLMRAANSCRCCRPRQKIPAVVVVAGTKLAPLFLTLAENSHRCCWRRQQIHAVVVDTSWHLQQICCWCCWHRHKLSNCTVPRGANIFVSFRKNLK